MSIKNESTVKLSLRGVGSIKEDDILTKYNKDPMADGILKISFKIRSRKNMMKYS